MAVSFFDTGSSKTGLSPLVYFDRISKKTRAAYEANFAKSANVKNEISYFKDKAPQQKTVDAFLNNYRLLSVTTSAFGLEDAMQYGYRTREIAKSDATDANSLLNKFSDQRYRELNLAFEFSKNGVSKLSDSATLDSITARYVTNEYERSLGQIDSSLQEAAYFIRRVGAMKNMNQLIADPILFGVVIDTLGISRASAGMAFTALVARIEKGFDINRIGDSAYVENFAKRFLAMRQVQTATSGGNSLVGMFKSSQA